MTKSVEVVLAIRVEVDEEYSGDQHAEDIIMTAKRTFPAATVSLLNTDIKGQSDATPGELVS